MYTYPSKFPDTLIKVIADNPKICKYIDIPLQHISDNVLKSMRRGISARRTKELLYKLKENIPDLAIRTTFIVGYPNETEKDFQELCDFISDIKFDHMGVFTFSVEENTSSFILGDPVEDELKEERKKILMEMQKEISFGKNRDLVGKRLSILLENKENDYFIGRSYRDAPEIDGEILIPGNNDDLEFGKFYTAEIFDCNEYDLFGKFVR